MMADSQDEKSANNKREIVATPVKSGDNKRHRLTDSIDFNSKLKEITGMEVVDDSSSCSIDIDAIVDKAMCAFTSMASNSTTKQKRSGGSGSSTGTNTDELFARMLSGLTTAIKETTKAVIQVVRESEERKFKKELELIKCKVQKLSLMSKYESDKLEQYSRRENIRFAGIDEKIVEEDALVKEIVKIAKDINVNIKPADISVAHRVGKKGGDRPRPVLARFVSRKNRDQLMKARKQLKDIESRKGTTYLNDDLTPLRAKLFSFVKALPQTERCNTSNGRIHCNTKDGRHLIIENADDLFNLGLDAHDID